MTGQSSLLDQALGLVLAAEADLSTKPGLEAGAVNMRCQEVSRLLEEAGAGMPADTADNLSAASALEAASAAIDEIPEGLWPLRLGLARVELMAATIDAQNLQR